MKLRETQETNRHDVCPRCGARIIPLRSSVREMVVTIVCGSLLLTVFVPACWMAEQWIERREHQILDHMVWHEPLDSWNQ